MNLTLTDFFFNIPIYSPIEINAENVDIFKEILDKTIATDFHGYNPFEKVESTFKIITDLIPNSNSPYFKEGGFGTVKIECKRTNMIFWYYILWQPNSNTLSKIGQYPSVADFHIYEVKQYNKLLSKEKLKEFTRAIGLAANGVGIGSFVYLRRIFEHLIEEAYNKAKSESTIDDSIFQPARMDNKIDLLSHYLPTFLVENKGMYSILSLGIHELDEKTCLAHFDTLRVGIEIILDEKLDEFKKQKKIEDAKKKLANLKQEIKK
ncbi:short-chain dehydrogenase [Polaribacter septentrionalilitoris]|uniref:short-chain dehydrogenase n=1 Tax=Polaribacter septentrionalilitoris TaxID=2494657 RepID=UPI001356A323|nr:short-chain dehydrogenase [Polaribacter septentrionalilitoris]